MRIILTCLLAIVISACVVHGAEYRVLPRGTADSRLAIQRALDGAHDSHAAGGIVKLEKGDYYLDGTLTNYPRVRLVGENMSSSTGGSGTRLIARGRMEAMIQSRSWTQPEFNHYAGVENMTLRADNADYGIQLHQAGENYNLRNIHIHSARKSGLWLTGSSATVRGSLVINGSGDKAIRITPHPKNPSNSGTIFFDSLSGDANTNGWFVINCSAHVSVGDWKIEGGPTENYPNGGETILITDDDYDGIAAQDGAFTVLMSIGTGSVNYGGKQEPSWTNWVRIDGSANVGARISQGLFRWSHLPRHLVWNEQAGEGIEGNAAEMGFIYATPNRASRIVYDVDAFHVPGTVSASDFIGSGSGLTFDATQMDGTLTNGTLQDLAEAVNRLLKEDKVSISVNGRAIRIEE